MYEQSVGELYPIGYRPEPASRYSMHLRSPPPNSIKTLRTTDDNVKASPTSVGGY